MSVPLPKPASVPNELEELLTRMWSPNPRKAAPEALAIACAQRWDPAEVVRVLLAEKALERDAAPTEPAARAPTANGKTFKKCYDLSLSHQTPGRLQGRQIKEKE